MQQIAETREEKIAKLEFEIQLFADFLRSPVWELLKSQWQPIVESTIGAAIGPKAVDRSFLAGKVNGLNSFLRYPEKHLKKLQIDLKTVKLGQQA